MRVVLFLALGFVAIAGFVALIAGQTAFESRSAYFIDFREISVNGVEIGSTVRYNGIAVGSVEDVEFGGESLDHVVVRVSIRDDVPLREDVKARLVPVGITGLREIELFGATAEADELEPRSHIPAQPSTIDRLTEPATNIANELEFVVFRLSELLREENRAEVESALRDISGILSENRGRISRIMRNVDGFVAETREPLSQTVIEIQVAAETLSATASELNVAVSQLTDNAEGNDLRGLLENLNRTVAQTEDSIRNIESVLVAGEDGLLDSLALLEETLEYLNNFAITISEDPSRLIR
ncbi:MAG: MCE family protein [Spirochaetes bacterium]|jgi:ABC-type transporter Mla subunit MlaD|nr:MCE family protein [Spirochaetota bacterium]